MLTLISRYSLSRLCSYLILVSALSGCVDFNYYQQHIGLMAPQPHPNATAIKVCQFQLSVSDPVFIDSSHQHLDSVIKQQFIKYLQHDGRIAINSNSDCQWQSLHIKLNRVSDTITSELKALVTFSTADIVIAGDITLSKAQQQKTFSHEERMQLTAMDDELKINNLFAINSVRNKTNFIDAVIEKIVSVSAAL
ncbi:hypothetical protein NO559_11280 [Dasania sp. GY-MA-18]|uniref:Uncharacterized protein n=1 Tax=Dasania phycosphaerae TaxID=2950436 RepID=A0A9J6RNN4_9GAMM|nr:MULTISPECIES: hypothetical protein [Dasania]MCR8923360.1 hypothetical protein [Dasania sp. GY-MA-18]MCZ0865792.1 hypothetical protein [Dasania phycosphaerae]MCZ0869517.1 hypothetical protein [Dasania phycosphaerae]